MEKQPQTCVLLRPKTTDAEAPTRKREVENFIHRQIMELTRRRIERDRAAKHVRCVILPK